MESPIPRLHRAVLLLLVASVFLALGTLAFQWAKAGVMRDAYRVRLADLELKHNALVSDYNQAVSRTAVCEVRQRGGKLSVVTVTADGCREEIPLAFDPAREIHFDFVCLADRLRLRRVYDDKTAPASGVLIESKLARVDWSKHEGDRGLVLYRTVEEGIYALKVSGTGSLTLEPVQQSVADQLVREPELRRHEPVEKIENADAEAGLGEILRGLWR